MICKNKKNKRFLSVRAIVPIVVVFIMTTVFVSPSVAGPWAAPGDLGLRHDLLLLGDAGLISAPLSSWPLSWGDIAKDLDDITNIKNDAGTPGLKQALRRVKSRIRQESAGGMHFTSYTSLSAKPLQLRTFNATPRESAEAGVGVEWMNKRLAYRLSVSGVYEPDDNNTLRLDGSYISLLIFKNWALSIDAVDRWWGPGWDGSLILSSNARPVPAIVLRRNYSDPFESKWLSWIGPWQLVTFLGRLEERRSVPDALLFGMRINFKPLDSLEFGLSRAAQWGGRGRPSNLKTFSKLLIGKDNLGGDGITADNEPGNQLAGYDMRWVSPVFKLPYAFYSQFIGEDEAGGLPSRHIGMYGLETWGDLQSGTSWRLRMEYADTAAAFLESEPIFNYTYNHGRYTDGYRYYKRSMGHSIDNDGQTLSLGSVMVDNAGRVWNVLARWAALNRDGDGQNSVTRKEEKIFDLEIDNTLYFGKDTISWGAGVRNTKLERSGEDFISGRLFVQLVHEF